MSLYGGKKKIYNSSPYARLPTHIPTYMYFCNPTSTTTTIISSLSFSPSLGSEWDMRTENLGLSSVHIVEILKKIQNDARSSCGYATFLMCMAIVIVVYCAFMMKKKR